MNWGFLSKRQRNPQVLCFSDDQVLNTIWKQSVQNLTFAGKKPSLSHGCYALERTKENRQQECLGNNAVWKQFRFVRKMILLLREITALFCLGNCSSYFCAKAKNSYDLQRGETKAAMSVLCSTPSSLSFLHAPWPLCAHWSLLSSLASFSAPSQAPVPQNSVVHRAHFDYPSTSQNTSPFYSPDTWQYFLSSQFQDSQERMLTVSSIFKAAVRGFRQGHLAATQLSSVWVKDTEGQTMENKSHLKHHLETGCTHCNRTHFSSYFPCRNKDLYYNSSFGIVFNIVRNIRFEWRWLNLDIPGVLFQNLYNAFMLTPNISLLQSKPYFRPWRGAVGRWSH